MTDHLLNRNNRYLAELTSAFSEWEKSGRGWRVCDYSVSLEPPFAPLKPKSHIISPVRDDAHIQSPIHRLFGGNQPNAAPIVSQTKTQIEAAKPSAFYRTEAPCELQILLSEDFEASSAITDQFLLSLSSCKTPIGFELVAGADAISVQLSCDSGFTPQLKNQLNTFFPDLLVSEVRNNLVTHLTNQSSLVIADFGLSRNFLLPLLTFRTLNPDPLTAILSSLDNLQGGEKAVFQILFQKTISGWSEEIQKLAPNSDFKDLLQTSTSSLKEKLSVPLFAVAVRVAVESPSSQRSWQILRHIGGALSRFSSPNSDELIALSNDSISASNHLLSVINRTSYRTGMLLNVSELAGLAHFPTTPLSKLKRFKNNTKQAPDFATEGNLVMGENYDKGKKRSIKLSDNERMKHLWLLGASGSGKSSLITKLVEQDIKAGNGVCVIEPHGDLIEDIIARIPEHRIKDVILFDPADEAFPIAFNILSAHSELERTLLSSDLVSIFRQFSTSWGDVIDNLLHNAILAFLSSTQGGTLIDLKHFLVEKEFREKFLQTISDDEIRFYWQREFPRLGGKPHGPLLTRVDTFLRSKLIRNIVAQKENRLDFRRIMDDRKILLVKLTHGAIGEEQSQMLGSLIMAKLYHAAISRQDISETQRSDFFIYADEAHHFIVPSMSLLLSGGRKFHTSLLFSNQETRQITSRDPEILSSLLTNCFTRVCFRLDSDAEILAKGFSFFTAEHLKNLGVGEAICRFEQSRFDFNLRTFPLEPIDRETALQRKDAVVEISRSNYATAKAEVAIENQNIEPLPVVALSDQSITVPSSPKNLTVSQIGESQMIPKLKSMDEPKPKFGRGGLHHQELQAVIKRVAETYGFRVEIEKDVIESTGRVDVSLEKEGLRIACEVSVTTTDYEVTNILKCLAAGYDFIVVVVSNQKKLPLLNTKIRAEIPIEHLDKIKAFGLTGLLGFLRELRVPKESARNRPEKPAGQRLNFADACELLNINSSTLYRWVREGRIPFYRPGREYQFDRDELVLIGKHDLTGKRKASVKLAPLTIGKTAPKDKKERNSRYRKLLKLD